MILRSLLVGLLFVSISGSAFGWPMYRNDASRTGYIAESLPAELSPTWSAEFEKPIPAWPRSDRMAFDRAFEPIVIDDLIVFGSSITGTVHALAADTGAERWRFVTEGPIRFAPAAWKDRLFVASDDGHLYCLASKTGELLWKKRGGPDHRTLLGNERLISKWPARGGPVVVDDTVYFAAGIWPSDGIYLYALHAESGETIWLNDDGGDLYLAQPHGGANAKSGVSAQGYLVANEDQLFVPTGRAVPACFDRRTGKFQYFHLQKYGHNGGAQTMAIGDMFFNNGLSFRADSGEREAKVSGLVAATADGLATFDRGVVNLYRWVEKEVVDRRGAKMTKQVLEPLGSVKNVHGGAGLIVVGEHVISGGEGQVDVVSTKTLAVTQSLKITGAAYGLVVDNGRLIVSTDSGSLSCFSTTASQDAHPAEPIAKSETVDAISKLAERILSESNVREGYCLDWSCGSGELAIALAEKSDLHIVAVNNDSAEVARLRKQLARRKLLGSRITVLQRESDDTGLPKYFADLVVAGRSVEAGDFSRQLNQPEMKAELKRLQQPYGGVACFGSEASFQLTVRGELKGAGDWTHQYAGPGNSLNSGDALVTGKLGMLWFRDIDFDVPQRHGRAPAPLFSDGRLFHLGLNGIIAVDAYNGRELWRYEIKGLLTAYDGDELMGVAGTGGACCLHGDSIYVRVDHRCLRLNVATGELAAEFSTPHKPDEKPGPWGYIACVGDTLFGSISDPEHVVTYRYVGSSGDMKRLLTESRTLFAMDSKTGDIKWRFDAKDSIRHNAIAISDDTVFLIDRPQAAFDRVKKSKVKEHAEGKLVAIDIASGDQAWIVKEQVFGTTLALSEKHDALLMCYQPTRFRLDSEFGGRMAAYSMSTGKPLWNAKATYSSRPMINDRTVYAQGGAWDLLTGEQQPFVFKRSYGCGVLSGAKDMLLFRSATLGYYNLNGSKMTENYGGMRPGCWVNVIPAGGIVMVPDATAGCGCSYLNKSWIALESE